MSVLSVWEDIIPRPAEISGEEGFFVVGTALRVQMKEIASGGILERVNAATDRLTRRGPSLFVPATSDGELAEIIVVTDPHGSERGSGKYPGAYRLDVTSGGITITVSDGTGLSSALATLVQAILLAERRGEETGMATEVRSAVLPSVVIKDRPAEQWRGFMLDVARHFFPLESLERILDILWLLRLNRFQIHLTDDQGWRLPIEQYPLLCDVGSWRSDETSENGRYGGFYTEAQLRQLDGNAALLGIAVVPEIDLPGHASAAVSSYPELSCDGESPGVETRWGIFPVVICATGTAARTFIEAVFDAAARIFSGPYIHIGGDEVLEERWRRCSRCTTREDPYQEIVRFMAETVLKLGRRPVAWDEAAGLDLPRQTIIINWRDPSGAVAALERGYDLVLAPERRAAYLDHKHRDSALEPGRLGVCTVLDAATFAPQAYMADHASVHHSRGGSILGGQANLWTEELLYHSHLEYMALVRLAAIAEGLWSGVPGVKRGGFLSSLERLRTVLGARGYAVYSGPFT